MPINEYFQSTFERKLIYIFRINDKQHEGCLKIGDATIKSNKTNDELFENCHELNYVAKERINSYTSTAGIVYELLHTELAVYNEKGEGLFENEDNGIVKAFRDYKVHDVLKRSGIENVYFDTEKQQNEWFKTDLQTAIKAIKCVKEGKTALNPSEITNYRNPIVFRPEQKDAIEKTIKVFKKSNRMLWNAKMRFGKTLSALQVVKKIGFKRTIIITHRPVVDDGWYNDFQKIFYDSKLYVYGSRNRGRKLEDLENSKLNYIYFASIQDLRGSELVGGNYDKNKLIYKLNWDLVIVDEAHEGTRTKLGQNVMDALIKPEIGTTKVLELSGTPFNLLTNYDIDSIYTWDYIMEQSEKQNWTINHYGDSNPYEELPKMNIYTYNLADEFRYEEIEDKAFNFKEFFRTWTGSVKNDGKPMPADAKVGDFVHESDIKSFLDLLCLSSDNNYPFSKDEYREYFRHTLWKVPGIKEGAALSSLLKEHPVFSQFDIVNVAGNGDADEENSDALRMVNSKITDHPEDTRTITISCGKLTTGVSVPAWTAVLMLSGTYATQASQYLQTIFRVQTPANINGRMKDNCYVFDFAPDRTLKMVTEAVQYSSKSSGSRDETLLANFLNYCPVISIKGSNMTTFSVNYLLQELKKAYAERVVKNGFDDTKIYNDELLRLSDIEISEFDKLKKKIGTSKQQQNKNEFEVNHQRFDQMTLEGLEDLPKKPKRELTEEEKRLLEEAKRRKKNRDTAISILRGISIRMPLLVYGIGEDVDVDITIDNFAEKIDPQSWEEFMPEGVDKREFKKFSKYYDKDVFVAAARRIRAISKNADDLEPTERTKKIAQLFSTFKNPDRETVLTPWNVVNMHMSETIGGYDFYDEKHEYVLEKGPRYVDNGLVTKKTIGDPNTRFLEINSKSGLYPLYLTFSIYKNRIKELEEDRLSFEEKQAIWDDVVRKNIYVICKTPMAKSVTQRTLLGYREGKANLKYFDDLLNQLKDEKKQENFIWKVRRGKYYWKSEEGEEGMNFNAVVGNPPYQGRNHQQIYPDFYLTSIKLGDYVSMIFPTGWQNPKNANNLKKMNCEKVKADPQIVFIDNRRGVFPGIAGAEWVNVLLWQKNYNNGLNGKQLIYTDGSDPEEVKLIWNLDDIEKPAEIKTLAKIVTERPDFKSLQENTSTLKPYGLRTDVFRKYEETYHLPPFQDNKENNSDLKVYGNNVVKYAPKDYPLPRKTRAIYKYKVFVPYAWGNMSEGSGLGGAYADIIIASPGEICTETYLESGCFEKYEDAKKHAKFLMTKFARALLYVNKWSQHSTTAWGAVPIEDYKEPWWNQTISEIDKHLFKKYCIPEDVANYVMNNIQTKNESNIENFE